MPENILITAGELSGDLHAAPVVRELKKIDPALRFFGAGGDNMRDEGVDLLADLNDLAVMGFTDIPRALPRLSKLKKRILQEVIERKSKLAILVDYPGFNLNLAKALKRLPNPPKVLEYIAPQVWAWRANRIETIRQVVDHLCVVFPFEEKLFKDRGVKATFVGHPLMDELDEYLEDEPDSGSNKPIGNPPLLALLPGSRKSVIKRHLGILLKASELVKEYIAGLRVGIGCAPGIDIAFYKKFISKGCNPEFHRDTRKLVRQADAAIVSSGTATLETALIGAPEVVIYKTSDLNYHIIKGMIQLSYVAMANIVAGKKIVPELLQFDAKPQSIARAVLPLLKETKIRDIMISNMRSVRNILSGKGAAENVAKIASDLLN